MGKKKKRGGDAAVEQPEVKKSNVSQEVASTGRNYTVSIAVSGSVINNAQSLELATRLAGQIARAATIFRIDEIIVFDDGESSMSSFQRTVWGRETGERTGGEFLARVLRYLEVPQYLRRALIPMNKSLRYAGQLPPLDAPHHLRKHAWLPYREGVVSNEALGGAGSYVDVGLDQDAIIKEKLDPGTRVTVAMGDSNNAFKQGQKLNIVTPSTPREYTGLYWGYAVRVVNRLSDIFSGPFETGYDYTIGTSEHGQRISTRDLHIPNFKHLLLVFGGPAGLEESMALDQTAKVNDVKGLFNIYLNTCPNQGSRTIRTEEAILISLQFLQEPLSEAVSLHCNGKQPEP